MKQKWGKTNLSNFLFNYLCYQDSSQINNIALANLEIEGIKLNMNNNIKNLVSNTEDLNVKFSINLGSGSERPKN